MRAYTTRISSESEREREEERRKKCRENETNNQQKFLISSTDDKFVEKKYCGPIYIFIASAKI